jgi:hypothetical protein
MERLSSRNNNQAGELMGQISQCPAGLKCIQNITQTIILGENYLPGAMLLDIM